MKIKITKFAERHFDKDFSGTKILNMTKNEVEKYINNLIINKTYKFDKDKLKLLGAIDGYSSFCRLLPIKNFTDAKIGSMPITLENYQYLRSGYSARRDTELPVFSRWLELPLGKPKADYLMFVLYSKKQIDKEALAEYKKEKELYDAEISMLSISDVVHNLNPPVKPELFNGDWGIVAILGQSHPNEEPMKPETMLRNALGKDEGGSGVKLNRELYMKSVNFWNKNATIK